MSHTSSGLDSDSDFDETAHDFTNLQVPSAKSLSAILKNLRTGTDSHKAKAIQQITEVVDSGKECDVQTLYEGPSKCKCCINWVDDYPDDLKSFIEQEAETKKKALVVRLGKNHQEGRPLALDSIVVQNLQIKELLSKVFQDYEGMTPNLNKLVLRAPFHPFFYRWDVFKELVTEQETNDVDAAAFSLLLFRILNLELRETREEIDDLCSKGVITFELLWALFHPGMEIYASLDGHDRVFLMDSSEYQGGKRPGLSLKVKFIDWDGEDFGFATGCIYIDKFSGTKKINELDVYPLAYHKSGSEIANDLRLRGEAFQSLKGVHYKAYTGDMLLRDDRGTKSKVDARIMIDVSAAPINLQPKRLAPLAKFSVSSETQFGDRVHRPPPPPPPIYHGGCGTSGYYPHPGMGEVEHPKLPKPPNPNNHKVDIPEKDLMLCNSHVVGYSLKDKKWGHIAVHHVKDVAWNHDAFPNLILPEGHKDLILAFVEGQLSQEQEFDDVIQGKGQGLTILLVGAPGTGKTLTGEAVADKVRQPLYMLSAGELGQDARRLEDKLGKVLELTKKWKAVLLLDECDVFLEKRSNSNLNHNEVVAVFLRVLEYYPGMLFLTTNRGDAIDPAFKSRIHLTLQYPELDPSAREQIWQRFISRSALENSFTSDDLASLYKLPLNGREIKNIIKISSLLAKREGKPLQLANIQTVLKATGQIN